MVKRIYTNLPVNTIVRLPHPRSGDSQGQETFLAPSGDNQTLNYNTKWKTLEDTEGGHCSGRHWRVFSEDTVSIFKFRLVTL